MKTATIYVIQFLFFKGSHDQHLSCSRLTSDLQMHGAVHGQGQRQEVEGVEASTDMSAGLTLHLGLELTVEQIHHDGAVPPEVVLPCLCRGKEHWHTGELR